MSRRMPVGENVTLPDGRPGQVWALAPRERDDRGRWRAMVWVQPTTAPWAVVLAPYKALGRPRVIAGDQLEIGDST
jgi:hypothetical protein